MYIRRRGGDAMKYQRHSETSRAAAIAILESADTLRGRVYRYIADHLNRDGVTDEQIQIGLQMNPSTQRPRRVELVEQGLVRDSGRTVETRSSRKATVWELVPKPTEAEQVAQRLFAPV